MPGEGIVPVLYMPAVATRRYMSDYPQREIDRIRDALEAREGVSEADAEALLAMSDHIELLGEAQYSVQRHEFLLKRCHQMARAVGGLAIALEDREAAERLVRWINTEQTGSPETNKDYRVALRMFGELTTDGEGKPDSIEWIPGGYPSNYDATTAGTARSSPSLGMRGRVLANCST
jgi:hypothetical protein